MREEAFWKCVCACVICEWLMSYYLSSFIHLADRWLPHMGICITHLCFHIKRNKSKTQNTMYHNKLLSQNGICRRFKQTGLGKCFCFFWRRQFSFPFCQVPVSDAITIFSTLVFQGKHFAVLISYNKYRPSLDMQE